MARQPMRWPPRANGVRLNAMESAREAGRNLKQANRLLDEVRTRALDDHEAVADRKIADAQRNIAEALYRLEVMYGELDRAGYGRAPEDTDEARSVPRRPGP